MTDPVFRAPTVRSRRVLHVLWSLGVGGAERALYQLALAQRDAGADVGVLLVSTPGTYGESLAAAGVPVFALDQRTGLDLTHVRAARRLFSRWPVVHFHGCEVALMAAAASADTRPYYTHRAGLFRYAGKRRVRYALANPVLRGFAGVAGNTHHAARVAAQLFSIPPERVATVYNGIDWGLLTPQRAPDDVRAELALPPGLMVLGTSGNLRNWKRVDLAIRAIARTASDVAFLIVGDGPVRQELQDLTRDLRLEERVRFVGMRTNVADFLQVMDAFVLPSGPEESFGNSAVEALGSGLPTIVMRDGGGLVEHVTHEKTGLIADGVDGLGAAINRLAVDLPLRRSLGAAAWDATRERYTTASMVAGYERLYAGAA